MAIDWGVIIGIAGVILAIWTKLQAAKKDEVEILRGIIEAQSTEIERLRGSLAELQCENSNLRKRVQILEEENKRLRSI